MSTKIMEIRVILYFSRYALDLHDHKTKLPNDHWCQH